MGLRWPVKPDVPEPEFNARQPKSQPKWAGSFGFCYAIALHTGFGAGACLVVSGAGALADSADAAAHALTALLDLVARLIPEIVRPARKFVAGFFAAHRGEQNS